MEIPSRPLVLTRGESTEITVINRLDMPTGVHWHGIELDSYYDGVGGWSGGEGQIAPVIMPADSFVVRMTPPRAGTFIFHAHVDDMRQIALGLYGALIVMPPGERRDPATDHLFIVSQLGRGQAAFTGLNGAKAPPPLTVAAGERQRLRFINISVADDADFTLGPAGSSDSSMVEWRALAKDGADLPPERSVTGPAHLFITPGETYDFEVTLPPGDYRLRMTGRDDAEVLVHAR
jgi:FtsP/CotA-like multicopper oxidase with cupredoxin domain